MRRRGVGRPAQPSLVNTAARTAVVVGTASAVSNKAASNQAAKAQAAAPAPQAPQVAPTGAPATAAPAALSDDVYDQLRKLGELREAGILTDDEFQAKKTQILGL
ncbi:MAG: SHOCT domain-containing protein [Acidimicrobiales bacterium]|nr:SHOCT domain-containing protein [Acidimicrobiales bacterium]